MSVPLSHLQGYVLVSTDFTYKPSSFVSHRMKVAADQGLLVIIPLTYSNDDFYAH